MKHKELKYVIIPIIILIDIYLYSVVAELISEKSDIAVIVGFGSLIALALLNYVTIKLIITKK